jgi:RING finger/CHY zinc finger protein 1
MKLPCTHYRRWLFPIHPDTGVVYPCRLCHDTAAASDVPAFPRHRVKGMVCAFCSCAQRVGTTCGNPDCTAYHKAHAYYCDTCHLWDDDRYKMIYHCAACGICRIGHSETYTHCFKCNMCVPRNSPTRPPHVCWGRLHDTLCPICYMECDAHSQDPVSFLACGHVLHTECFQSMCLNTGHFQLKCPTCNQVVV